MLSMAVTYNKKTRDFLRNGSVAVEKKEKGGEERERKGRWIGARRMLCG
jgi:hypothetical protein